MAIETRSSESDLETIDINVNVGPQHPATHGVFRMILSEMNRIASHLMFFGAFGTDIGLFGTSFMYAFRDRETIQDFFEEITGERMMYNYFRPGGVAWDVPENFHERCKQVLA